MKARISRVSLTVAGSDCSGGAGLEADLKTFTALGVYGMAVVTCVVAERPGKVDSIHPVPVRVVEQQMDSCLQGMTDVGVKTGMLHAESVIRAVSRKFIEHAKVLSDVVVDPVMVATSGARLLRKKSINAMQDFIGQHADLVTPNVDEAEILSGQSIRNEDELMAAGERIHLKFGCSVLMKGGHLKDLSRASDFLVTSKGYLWFRSPRIKGVKTHGTGCTYSSAITAGLSSGLNLEKAIRQAKDYLTDAIRESCRFKPWMALNHAHRVK